MKKKYEVISTYERRAGKWKPVRDEIPLYGAMTLKEKRSATQEFIKQHPHYEYAQLTGSRLLHYRLPKAMTDEAPPEITFSVVVRALERALDENEALKESNENLMEELELERERSKQFELKLSHGSVVLSDRARKYLRGV